MMIRRLEDNVVIMKKKPKAIVDDSMKKTFADRFRGVGDVRTESVSLR